MWEVLKGKKTYLTAVVMVAYAVGGVFIGELSYDQAAGFLFGATGFSTLRHAKK